MPTIIDQFKLFETSVILISWKRRPINWLFLDHSQLVKMDNQ